MVLYCKFLFTRKKGKTNMFMTGDKFYYADRNKGVPVKCTTLDCQFGYPPKIVAQREDNGTIFYCRAGFLACMDAQIKEDRFIK